MTKVEKEYHGIALPLSALRTKISCGIGEFLDLLPLISWCNDVGFNVIQLLPLFDSGPDPSPYNGLSGSALHPIYISLQALPCIEDHTLQKLIEDLKKLNRTKRVAYHKVLRLKELFFLRYFELEGAHICQTEDFQDFYKRNDHLMPYALFKVLKENMEGLSWEDWPEKIRDCSHTHYKELLHEHKEQITYHFFLQYLAYNQLKEVKIFASSKQVYMKGDIPILISPDSADVWHHKEFFDLQYAAGAAPDRFTPDGQYWGFPLYRWKELAREEYAWWKNRLHYAENFFHFYRLDHIIGFFRIWAIKRGKAANEGSFIPSEEWEALAQGKELLSIIRKCSSMMPIGEDLGIVFDGMMEALRELKIPGTKVMRWEEEDPKEYPELSMTTLSTHDSETLAQWWEDEPKEAKALAKLLNIPYKTPLSQSTRIKIIKAAHHSSSQFHIDLLGEFLALFPELIHSKPDDERINRPGKVLPKNWTYRFRPKLEKIISHKELKSTISDLFRA